MRILKRALRLVALRHARLQYPVDLIECEPSVEFPPRQAATEFLDANNAEITRQRVKEPKPSIGQEFFRASLTAFVSNPLRRINASVILLVAAMLFVLSHSTSDSVNFGSTTPTMIE